MNIIKELFDLNAHYVTKWIFLIEYIIISDIE